MNKDNMKNNEMKILNYEMMEEAPRENKFKPQ